EVDLCATVAVRHRGLGLVKLPEHDERRAVGVVRRAAIARRRDGVTLLQQRADQLVSRRRLQRTAPVALVEDDAEFHSGGDGRGNAHWLASNATPASAGWPDPKPGPR